MPPKKEVELYVVLKVDTDNDDAAYLIGVAETLTKAEDIIYLHIQRYREENYKNDEHRFWEDILTWWRFDIFKVVLGKEGDYTLPIPFDLEKNAQSWRRD